MPQNNVATEILLFDFMLFISVLFISALHHNACHNQKDALAKQELPETKETNLFRETNFLNFSS
jgi:hypothetical protein